MNAIPGLGAVSPFGDVTRQRLFGVYPALVRDVNDPDGQGRVKIVLPWVAEQEGEQAAVWARLATLMAGAERGSWFVPEPDDEVLVAFAAGDPRHPIVIGALWNGRDAAPEDVAGGENNIRSFTSRAGHKLTFDDSSGAEKVEVVTAAGHSLLLDDGQSSVKLTHSSGAESIEIDAGGSISITASSEVTIDAPAGLTVTASMVTVDAAMSKFSGVVKCETLITNSVVSSSYTPGAGNVW